MAKQQLSGIQIPTLSKLNVDGEFTLDAASGTTGQVLISQGSGNTPAWTSTPNLLNPLLTSVSTVGGGGSEGGQINFARVTDGTQYWAIDSFGATASPSLRFIENVTTRVQIDTGGIVNLSGSLKLRSGGTGANAAPLYFGTTSQAILAQPIAGAIENDANVFYGTPKVVNSSSGRGILPTVQMYVINANTTISTGGGPSVPYGGNVMAALGIYLASSTTYEVSGTVYVQTNYSGPPSTAFVMGMSFPSGATLLVNATWQYVSAINSSSATSTRTAFNSAATQTISSTVTNGYWARVTFDGIVKISVPGTFSPQFFATNASGGTTTLTVGANSYLKVTPIGATGSDINVGGWA